MSSRSWEDLARLRADLALGVRIGRAEFVKEWRRQTSNRRLIVAGAILLVVAVPTVFGVARSAYGMGRMVASGGDLPILPVARNLLVPFLIAFGLVGGLGAAQRLGDNAGMPLLLTTVPNRAIVFGQFLRDQGQQLFLIILLVVVVGIPFAAGVGSPIMAVALFVAFVPLVVLGTLLGQVFAYALWIALLALPVPAGFRRVFGAVAGFAIVVVSAGVGSLVGYGSGSGDLALPTGPPLTPLGWYADLLFLGSPLAPAVGPRTILAGVVVLGAIPVAIVASVRLAPRVWYATATDAPAEPDARSESAPGTRRTFLGMAGPTGRSRTLRVAFAYLLRARRRPDRFVYVLYYGYVLAMLFIPVLSDPGLARTLVPAALVVLGTLLAGGVFCLNPLGSEGSMLGELVLTDTPAATLVHARLLAGILLGLVLSLPGLGLLFALDVVPLSNGPAALVVVVGVVVASAALALGVGSFAPRFETTRVLNAAETVAPSALAGVVHAVIALVLLSGGGLAVLAGHRAFFSGGWVARWGPVGVVVLVVALLVDGCRRYAIRRVGTYGRARADTDRDPILAAHIALWLSAIATVVAYATVASTAIAGALELPPWAVLVTLFVATYVGFVAIAAGFLYVTERWPGYLDVSWPDGVGLGYSAAGLVACLLLWGAYATAVSRFGLPSSEHQVFESAAEIDPVLVVALMILALVVVGPVEELLYRNVIQKYLAEHTGTSVAIGIASLLFALVHVPVYFDPSLAALAGSLALIFVLSCVFGVIYARTGNVVVPALVHGVYDAVVFGALFFVG